MCRPEESARVQGSYGCVDCHCRTPLRRYAVGIPNHEWAAKVPFPPSVMHRRASTHRGHHLRWAKRPLPHFWLDLQLPGRVAESERGPRTRRADTCPSYRKHRKAPLARTRSTHNSPSRKHKVHISGSKATHLLLRTYHELCGLRGPRIPASQKLGTYLPTLPGTRPVRQR